MSKNTFYNVDGDNRSSVQYTLLELTTFNTEPNFQGASLCITNQNSLDILASVGDSNYLNQYYYVVVVRNDEVLERYNIFNFGGNDCYGFTPYNPMTNSNFDENNQAYSVEDFVVFQQEISSYLRNDSVYIVPRRGCTNPAAQNYNPFVILDDGNCVVQEEQINDYTIQQLAEDYWEFVEENCDCLEVSATFYPSDEVTPPTDDDILPPQPFNGGLSGSRMNFGGSGGGKFSNNNSDDLARLDIIPSNPLDENVVMGTGSYDDVDNRCLSVKQYLVDVVRISDAEMALISTLSVGTQSINVLADAVYAWLMILATKCTGCMDAIATNYNPEAIFQGDCEYDDESVPDDWCADPMELANQLYEQYGCDYTQQDIYDIIDACKIETQSAINSYFLQISDALNGWCDLTEDPPVEPEEDIEGCMDSTYDNYNPYATINVGCQNYDIDTTPTGNADNSDLYAGLLGLDGDYGDLIDDTILLIQNLQTAYEEALATGGDTALLTQQINDANQQLNEILSTDGLLNVISDAVIAAESGNHNPAPLNAISSELVAAPNGQSGMQYITSINNALQTISDYANNTSTTIDTNFDLVEMLADANAQIDLLQGQLDDALANQEDGVSQTDVDAVQFELDQLIVNINTILSQLTTTPPTGATLPDVDNLLVENSINNLLSSYNDLVVSYNALATAYTNANDGITQADVDAAAAAATAAAILALQEAGLETGGGVGGIPIQNLNQLEASLFQYVMQYISENGYVQSDVVLTQEQLTQQIQQGIAQFIAEYIAGDTSNLNQVTQILSDNLTDHINGLIEAAVDEAVSTNQAANDLVIEDLELQLLNAQIEIQQLTDALNDGAGTNALSNQTLQEAYDLIEQMEADAEAQFQIYQDDIAAYNVFLANLSTSMGRLETFLSDNYGYTAYDSSTIPSGVSLPTTLTTGEGADVFLQQQYGSFSGNSIPIQDIYLNFAGRTIGVSRAFKQFKGVEPMRNANGTFESGDATFELNESTRKILWGAGIVIFTLGAFQLIKRQ